MIDIKQEFELVEELPWKETDFNRITEPLSPYRDLCALLYLAKLLDRHGKTPVNAVSMIAAAESDMIWLSVDCDTLEEIATPDDILYLYRCGVHLEDYELTMSA